jgi:hypothetical protein
VPWHFLYLRRRSRGSSSAVVPNAGSATAVQQRGPKRGESDRNGQVSGYQETLIISDVSVVGRFGQDRRTTFRIPLGLKFSLFYKGFRDALRLRATNVQQRSLFRYPKASAATASRSEYTWQITLGRDSDRGMACSRVRAGSQIPHPRHWCALIPLVSDTQGSAKA